MKRNSVFRKTSITSIYIIGLSLEQTLLSIELSCSSMRFFLSDEELSIHGSWKEILCNWNEYFFPLLDCLLSQKVAMVHERPTFVKYMNF